MSGKSTIHRHIRALNGFPIRPYERLDVRATILENMRSASLLLQFHIEHCETELIEEERQVCTLLIPFFDYSNLS